MIIGNGMIDVMMGQHDQRGVE